MIGYITLGTNDIQKSSAYYDELLATVGAKRVFEGDNFVAWGTSPSAPALSVIKPFNGETATVGNGVMISLVLDSTEEVDTLHSKALELGSVNEGAPGTRNEGGFYISYFRDLDGNKLAAYAYPTTE